MCQGLEPSRDAQPLVRTQPARQRGALQLVLLVLVLPPLLLLLVLVLWLQCTAPRCWWERWRWSKEAREVGEVRGGSTTVGVVGVGELMGGRLR
mgnify:CR=1 FL=1